MATASCSPDRGRPRLPPTDVFAALASPVRREILNLLLVGPQPVNAIASRFDMRRPSVSEHLRVLRDAGLVSEQRDGRQRYYQLEPNPLTDVRDWLTPYERFWRTKLFGRPSIAQIVEHI